MPWPVTGFPGKVLLLSSRGSFNAMYLRTALQFCGMPIVAVEDMQDPLLDAQPNGGGEIVGCVAVDLDAQAATTLIARQLGFPVVFVGGYPGLPMPDAHAWMNAPFASYQVIERLMTLVMRPPGAGHAA